MLPFVILCTFILFSTNILYETYIFLLLLLVAFFIKKLYSLSVSQFNIFFFFFFQAEDGIRDWSVTGVQTCALPISDRGKDLFCLFQYPARRRKHYRRP